MARPTIKAIGDQVEDVVNRLRMSDDVSQEELEKAYCNLDILLGLQLSAVYVDIMEGGDKLKNAMRGLKIAMGDMAMLFKMAMHHSPRKDELAEYMLTTGVAASVEMMMPPDEKPGKKEKEPSDVNGNEDPKAWQ